MLVTLTTRGAAARPIHTVAVRKHLLAHVPADRAAEFTALLNKLS